MVNETMVKKECLFQMKFKNDSNDFISNIKETVDVTLATDDDRQLEAHKSQITNHKSFTNQ
jgi:hypothetical protein